MKERYGMEQIIHIVNQRKNISDEQIEIILQKLLEKGYKYNEIQKNFIRDHLYFSYTFDAPRAEGYTETVIIDPLKIEEMIDRERVQEYENYTGKDFMILGEVAEEDMVIYIDEFGTLYGCNEDYLIEYSNSFEKFLFNLMNGKDMEVKMV